MARHTRRGQHAEGVTVAICVAIDLGASNGRVVAVDCDGERLALREARRFDTPRRRDRETGYQCWDIDGIESEIAAGLRAAAALSPAPLASVGVDGWAVDHVLVDAALAPVAPAVSYRDDRNPRHDGSGPSPGSRPRRSTGAPGSSSSRSTRSTSWPRPPAGIPPGWPARATS